MSNSRFSIVQAKAVADRRLSSAQFRTLSALGTFGDSDGWCYPRLSTLAEMLGKSRQAVSADIQALVRLGYIEVTAQFRDDGSRRGNLYRLVFDAPLSEEVSSPALHPSSSPLHPSTSGLYTPSSPALHPSTSEVDALTTHINDPINGPLKQDNDADKPRHRSEPAATSSLTEGQRLFLQKFCAKRFANNTQKQAVQELSEKYPATFEEAVNWAAIKGLKIGQAIGALQKALPTWGQARPKTNGRKRPKHQPSPEEVLDQLKEAA